MMTQIDLSLSSDLQWTHPPDPQGIYHLHFGFEMLDPFDTCKLNAYLLAVETFSQAYPQAKNVIMATLDGKFSFMHSNAHRFEELLIEENLPNTIICANLFSDYLHRLASALPEETVATIVIRRDPHMSLAKMAWLFCKRRFEHFNLTFEGSPIPVLGNTLRILSLPEDRLVNLDCFERVLATQADCSCIPEEYLNEYWGEAKEIFYDPETISELGKRMLIGFQATGGVVKKAG